VHGVAPGAVHRAGLLLQQRRLVREGAAATAVLLGDGQAQQADLASLAPELAVHLLLLRPALGVRDRLLLQEGTGQLGELVHVGAPPAGPVGGRGQHRHPFAALANKPSTSDCLLPPDGSRASPPGKASAIQAAPDRPDVPGARSASCPTGRAAATAEPPGSGTAGNRPPPQWLSGW